MIHTCSVMIRFFLHRFLHMLQLWLHNNNILGQNCLEQSSLCIRKKYTYCAFNTLTWELKDTIYSTDICPMFWKSALNHLYFRWYFYKSSVLEIIPLSKKINVLKVLLLADKCTCTKFCLVDLWQWIWFFKNKNKLPTTPLKCWLLVLSSL